MIYSIFKDYGEPDEKCEQGESEIRFHSFFRAGLRLSDQLPAARGNRLPTDNNILLAGVAGQLLPMASRTAPLRCSSLLQLVNGLRAISLDVGPKKK